jgi:hypothetical protein
MWFERLVLCLTTSGVVGIAIAVIGHLKESSAMVTLGLVLVAPFLLVPLGAGVIVIVSKRRHRHDRQTGAPAKPGGDGPDGIP